MTLASGGFDEPVCGPPASFSVHMASSEVTPAGSVHNSRGIGVGTGGAGGALAPPPISKDIVLFSYIDYY